jgi:two-component system sensor histidine kinase ChvG
VTLKRQLLLVSLLALMLPWAGCEFIRETESALRSGQQQMLAGTARALANSMSQYSEEYPDRVAGGLAGEQLFLHTLSNRPRIDGYVDDWLLDTAALRSVRGAEGPIRFALGSHGRMVYVYIEVSDQDVVFADRVVLISSNPPYLEERFVFAAEAPGAIVSFKQGSFDPVPEPAISAYWQDVPGGYRVEAKIPANLLGTHLGFMVNNAADEDQSGTRTSSYSGPTPLPVARPSPELLAVAANLVQPGMRIIVTDSSGWRLASAGALPSAPSASTFGTAWSQRIYELLVEPGKEAASAEPDPTGREQQPYVSAAIGGREMAGWFRGDDSGSAIVAVASPITDGNGVVGARIVQQGTDAILSL